MKDCIPNKFLCQFSLTTGALFFGIVMIIVKALCLIVTILVTIDFSYCNSFCTDFITNNAYGFNATAIVYCVIMIMVHLCFIWAIKRKKSALIIAWVVITTLWLIKTIFLIIVLLFLYSKQTSFAIFIVCVVLAILSFIIAVYALLIGFGLWREMLAENTRENT